MRLCRSRRDGPFDREVAGLSPPFAASYVLPIASQMPQTRALSGYLSRVSRLIDDVIVIDGSPDAIFAAHAQAWSRFVRHLRPAIKATNGKVAGVLTGVRAARHDKVIIADDDVRYRRAELQQMLELLETHDFVRPQNFFRPLPWHARWDTSRILLNRLGDGDWPGTLGVRRSTLLAAGGYSGEVLFENLELGRTMRAAGGQEAVLLDLFVARRPPGAAHFWSQRPRQAYDEWARPTRLAAQLALLPASILGGYCSWSGLGAAVLGTVAAAEIGRRRANGRSVFPPSSAFWAPAWLAERALTSWMALGMRLFLGGVRYRDTRLRDAATPPHILAARVRTHMSAVQSGDSFATEADHPGNRFGAEPGPSSRVAA